MLSIVILVCAATVERSDCTTHTALMVRNGPPAASSAGCGLDAEIAIASIVRIEPGEYVKILCRGGGGGGRSVDEARLSQARPAAR